MYGAKAIAIATVAKDTFGVKPKNEKQEGFLQQAVFAIAENNSVELNSLNLPTVLQKEEFRRLVISLAKNPLIA